VFVMIPLEDVAVAGVALGAVVVWAALLCWPGRDEPEDPPPKARTKRWYDEAGKR